MLKLDTKINEGDEREVYLHPLDSARIVKIMKPGHETQRWDRNQGELAYYERLNDNQKSRLSALYGLVDTDRGRGSVAQFIRDADGNASSPVHARVEDGHMTVARAEAMLDDFFAWADRNAIALVTANMSNFLCQVAEDGSCRLIMIDGFGPASMTLKGRLRLHVPALVRLRTAKTRARVMAKWRVWADAQAR